MSNSHKKKLLTAGCGISQSSFRHWPTWVKYPEMTHELSHINIGGPASGNEYIAQNIIKNLKLQMSNRVRWTESILELEKNEENIIIEIGPGKVL